MCGYVSQYNARSVSLLFKGYHHTFACMSCIDTIAENNSMSKFWQNINVVHVLFCQIVSGKIIFCYSIHPFIKLTSWMLQCICQKPANNFWLRVSLTWKKKIRKISLYHIFMFNSVCFLGIFLKDIPNPSICWCSKTGERKQFSN